MCGICGIVDVEKSPTKTLLRAMNDCIYHRGPDDDGVYVDNLCGLAMRRLAIIDLHTGKQPIHNEDKTIWVVLNGEIYNFIALKKKLINLGHQFYTQTDTEVIVHLYEEYGEDMVTHLWGMFGFALWDKSNHILILARDRVGKKPLYFFKSQNRIVFASEIKSILQDDQFTPEIDHQSLYHFLTLQYIPSPNSIFNGVQKLPPAHLLIYKDGQSQIKPYWQLNMAEKVDYSYGEAKEKLNELLMDAVKIRMISDVPLGAFLSGGIDSSLIVGLMARQSQIPIKTFTICFDEESHNESPYAKIIAEMFGTEHHEIKVKADAQSIFDDLIWYLDEPFGDPSAIPSYFVAKAAREHITVALNGDGGDDSFGGYQRYYLDGPLIPGLNIPVSRLSWLKMNPIKNFFLWVAKILPVKKLSHYIQLFYHEYNVSWDVLYARLYMSIFNEQLKGSLLSQDIKNSIKGVLPTETILTDFIRQCQSHAKLDRLLFCDFHTYLSGDLLTKMDRMTMANSLEGRSPLLDHRIIEFAASLPWQWKGQNGVGKKILRDTFPDILIDKIANRPKMGFGVPLGQWFQKDLREFVFDTLDCSTFYQRGFFQKEHVQKLINEHMQGHFDHYHRIWLLLVIEMWCQMYLDKKIHQDNQWHRFKKVY